MASQRPWFRLSSMRPAAPAPAPAAPPVRPPVIVRPPIPFRPPTQAQDPPPPPAAPAPPVVTPTPPPPPATAPVVTPTPPPPPVTAPVATPPPVTAPVVTPTPPPPPVTAPVVTPTPPPPAPPITAPVVTPPRTPPPPSSPVTKAPPPRSPPLPSSPVTKAALTSSTNFKQPSPSPPASSKPTSPVLNAKAAASPKIVKPSPAQMKPLSSSDPPSPLSLPPPKMEQKNVVVHESIDKPMKTQNGKRQDKKVSDSEESGMRIITIAGENRGAVMEVSSVRKKSHGNQESNNKDKNGKTNTMHTQPKTTFLNSNVQGINNSIVFNTKCHHNDPGIHLSLQVTKPKPNPKD